MNTGRTTCVFDDAERLRTAEEEVWRFAQKDHNEAVMSFMAEHFRLNSKDYRNMNGEYQIPTLIFDNDTQFVFENIREVYYLHPFDRPDCERLLVINNDGTLFANFSDTWFFAPYLFIIGNDDGEIPF